MRGFLTVSLRIVFSRLGPGLVLALGLAQGGCGGCDDNNSVRHLPDAPPAPDAAADAMPPDAVSLAVINQGVPAVGVPVYFLNADGSVALAGVTDGNGIASAVVTAGGSVTAVRPFTTLPAPAATAGGPDELRTFLGVKPGDHLVLSRAVTDTVTVTFDAAAPDGGDFSTAYQVFTTCGGGANTLNPGGSSNGSASPDPGNTLQLDNCHGAADVAVVAAELARAGGNALATPQGLYHASATLPVGGNVTVSLRDDAYADLKDVNFTYMNGPDATITVQHWPALPDGYLGPYSTAGGGTLTLSEAATPATTAVVDSQLILNNQHDIIDWGPFSTDYHLDLSNLLLREVTDGPTYDIPTAKITWTEATNGATPDLTVTAIQVSRGEATWRWAIAAPYASSGIAFPHLPADAATWVPADGDVVTPDGMMSAQVSGGYNAVRAHVFDIHDQLHDNLDATGFAIGNGGRAVVVQFPVVRPQARARR